MAKVKTLIVGEDGEYRAWVAAALARSGFDVEVAEFGAEAMERLSAAAYALVVGFFALPDMGGVELASGIRALPVRGTVGPAVVLLQSEERPPDEDRDLALAHAAGADACLLYSHPADAGELVATARWALDSRQDAARGAAAASAPLALPVLPALPALPAEPTYRHPPARGGRTALGGLLLLLSGPLILLLLWTPFLLLGGCLRVGAAVGALRLEPAVRSSVSPDGRTRLEVDPGGGARLVRVATGSVLHRRQIPVEDYSGVEARWRPDGRRVELLCRFRLGSITMAVSGDTLVWDVGTGVLRNDRSGEVIAPE